MEYYIYDATTGEKKDKLRVRMWASNDNSRRDRLLAMLITKALERGDIEEGDLRDAGFLHSEEKIAPESVF